MKNTINLDFFLFSIVMQFFHLPFILVGKTVLMDIVMKVKDKILGQVVLNFIVLKGE